MNVNVIPNKLMLLYSTVCTGIFNFFCVKYLPADGPLRLKLVANSRIAIKYYIVVRQSI